MLFYLHHKNVGGVIYVLRLVLRYLTDQWAVGGINKPTGVAMFQMGQTRNNHRFASSESAGGSC